MARILIAFVLLISVTPTIGQNSVRFSLNNDTESAYTLDVLRFYISGVSLIYCDGSSFNEAESYHLIDLENPETFTIPLETKRAYKSLQAITFTLGTDSLINVSGIFDGDLDPINGMYWAWNSGYINFKVKGSTKHLELVQNFEYHLGGYLPPFTTARTITLPIKKGAEKIKINLDLDGFLNALDMHDQYEILIPGEAASNLSDQLSKRFSIDE